jgi:lysylphosphatidylglycerol synthetase-like protein (DUF2156 family)
MIKINKKIKNILILFILIIILILPYFVFANPAINGLTEIQIDSGYDVADQTSMSKILGMAVNGFLSILAIIFIILMLYGGYIYMTAGGDESKVTKSSDIIKRAIIGLIIVIGSYAIWAFVFKYLFTA